MFNRRKFRFSIECNDDYKRPVDASVCMIIFDLLDETNCELEKIRTNELVFSTNYKLILKANKDDFNNFVRKFLNSRIKKHINNPEY